MSLRAIAPGPSATIQDDGRLGFRAFGVPISGPFDRVSATVANALVGNEIGAAVLEMNGFGGVYMAETTIAIALAGAAMAARIVRRDGSCRTLSIPCATTLNNGDRLILGAAAKGFRLYLAAAGGLFSPEILGSRSDGRPIVSGDLLLAKSSWTAELRTALGRLAIDDSPIRYIDGPDSSLMLPNSLDHSPYVIGRQSDCMGVRLDGARTAVESAADRLSSPVMPGAIQIAGGQPIVLGPQCGTMGGYPHVGSVVSADLNRIGQMPPGDLLRFRRVKFEDAWAIDRDHRMGLAELALRLATAAGSFVTLA